uniref:Uncharacterized protein n=1 Tax=Arundo donax TaxID=35708 RepID=A0A0A9B2K4_ARUDO
MPYTASSSSRKSPTTASSWRK